MRPYLIVAVVVFLSSPLWVRTQSPKAALRPGLPTTILYFAAGGHQSIPPQDLSLKEAIADGTKHDKYSWQTAVDNSREFLKALRIDEAQLRQMFLLDLKILLPQDKHSPGWLWLVPYFSSRPERNTQPILVVVRGTEAAPQRVDELNFYPLTRYGKEDLVTQLRTKKYQVIDHEDHLVQKPGQ